MADPSKESFDAVFAFLSAVEHDPRPIRHACIRCEHWIIEGPRHQRQGALWLALPLTTDGEPCGYHVWSSLDFRGPHEPMPTLTSPPQVAASLAMHFAAELAARGLPVRGGIENER